MKIFVYFSELSEYIKAHYGAALSFSKVSESEICASYNQNLFFRTIQVPVNLKIEEVKASSINVSYNGGFGIDMIITGVLSFIKAKVPELGNAIITEEGHRIRIELSRLQQTESLVKVVNLQNITILNDGLEISASLK